MTNETDQFAYGNMRISRQAKENLSRLLADSSKLREGRVTAGDIEDLPSAAQRYLRHAGVIGKPRYRIVRLTQEGAMRMAPEKKWLPLKAVQYYSIGDPGFVWFGRVRFAPLIGVTAVDSYLKGEGGMLIKPMSLFTVVDQKGPEMREASLMRFLNEMMWFPTSYLNDNVSWEQIDNNSVIVRLTDHGLKAEGTLNIDVAGRVIDFAAKRHSREGKELKLRTWRTPICSYKEMAGFNLPWEVSALYEYDSGDFHYIRAKVTSMEFDPPGLTRRG